MLSGKRFLCPSYSECLFLRDSWGSFVSPKLGWGFVDHRTAQGVVGRSGSCHQHIPTVCTAGTEYWFPASIASPSSFLLFPLSHFELQLKSQNALYWHFLLQWKCSFVLKRSSRNGIIEFHIYCILVTSQKIVLACTQRSLSLAAN